MMDDLNDKFDYIESIYGNSRVDDEKKVLQLLEDSEEMVRIQMIEACYAVRQENIHKALWKRLDRTIGLEKGYLLLTLSYIYKNQSDRIMNILLAETKSTDQNERIDAYAGLVILGQDIYVNYIVDFFDSENYRLRCAACNLLCEIISWDMLSEERISFVFDAVMRLSKKEKTNAVNSSIKTLINIINRQ